MPKSRQGVQTKFNLTVADLVKHFYFQTDGSKKEKRSNSYEETGKEILDILIPHIKTLQTFSIPDKDNLGMCGL